MTLQKRSGNQDDKYKFYLDIVLLEHTNNDTYLGLNISNTGSFHMVVNELRDKARRAFYAIKRNIKIEIPIRIWLKNVQSVIEPIALYGSEVWGPISNNEFTKWGKHPIEILHAEFCKTVLQVQRKTPNNVCRADLTRKKSHQILHPSKNK